MLLSLGSNQCPFVIVIKVIYDSILLTSYLGPLCVTVSNETLIIDLILLSISLSSLPDLAQQIDLASPSVFNQNGLASNLCCFEAMHQSFPSRLIFSAAVHCQSSRVDKVSFDDHSMLLDLQIYEIFYARSSVYHRLLSAKASALCS
jgi:hypothetical protein